MDAETDFGSFMLKKFAKTLHHLDEVACNQELSNRQFTRRKNIESEIVKICEILKLVPYCQTDPRGCPLYLLESEEDKNNYHSKGIAICG